MAGVQTFPPGFRTEAIALSLVRKPSVISRTQHRGSALTIGPRTRCGRSVPAIRAENTSNVSWLSALARYAEGPVRN